MKKRESSLRFLCSCFPLVFKGRSGIHRIPECHTCLIKVQWCEMMYNHQWTEIMGFHLWIFLLVHLQTRAFRMRINFLFQFINRNQSWKCHLVAKGNTRTCMAVCSESTMQENTERFKWCCILFWICCRTHFSLIFSQHHPSSIFQWTTGTVYDTDW